MRHPSKKKAHEIAMRLYEETKQSFPEIEFHTITPHPEQAGRYWIRVYAAMDEDRQEALSKFVAERSINILISEGVSLAMMVDEHALEAA
jgi:hypothetical protein